MPEVFLTLPNIVWNPGVTDSGLGRRQQSAVYANAICNQNVRERRYVAGVEPVHFLNAR